MTDQVTRDDEPCHYCGAIIFQAALANKTKSNGEPAWATMEIAVAPMVIIERKGEYYAIDDPERLNPGVKVYLDHKLHCPKSYINKKLQDEFDSRWKRGWRPKHWRGDPPEEKPQYEFMYED